MSENAVRACSVLVE